MPKFTRNISPEDQAQIQEAGQNPAEYLLDQESGELMHQDDAPGLGIGGNLMEAAKGVGRGALSVVSAAPSLAGTTADAIRRARGTYDPNDPSGFTKLAKGIESFAPEADPRAHWLVSDGGEALGNIGGMVVGGGLASKLGKKAIERTALALGAEQMAADTAEQELARQLREGEQVSPWKVGGKAVAVGSVGSGIEALGGVGKLLDDLKKPANTLGQIGKRAGVNVGTGSLTEMGQQGFQDKLVEGEISGENLFRAGVLGGGAQGVTSAGLDVALRDPAKPWFGQPEEEVDVDSLKGKIDTSGVREGDPGPGYTPTPLEMQALVKRQTMKEKPALAFKNEVTDAVDKLNKSGFVLDEGQIGQLYSAWAGNGENAEAVQKVAQDLQNKFILEAGEPMRTTLDVIGEEQTVRGKYDKLIKIEEGQIAKNAKILADPNAPQGTRVRAQAELVAAQNNLQTLLTQRTTELGGIRPADPIDTRVANVSPAPNIDTGSPGVRTTVTREGRPAGFPNPAQVTDVQTVERGNLLPAPQSPTPVPPNPQVTPEAIGPAIPMGTGQRASEQAVLAPQVPPVDPGQEAARLQREKERQILSGQEGEQGSPFGNTRYSGIPFREILSRVKIKSTGADIGRGSRVVAENMYDKPVPETVGKEILQNALDAVEGQMDKKIEYGNTSYDEDFRAEENRNVFYIRDFGKGMSPAQVLQQFLRAFTSGKVGNESRGSFGLAKLVLLNAPEKWKLRTVGDNSVGQRVSTTVEGKKGQHFDYLEANDVSIDDTLFGVPQELPGGIQVIVEPSTEETQTAYWAKLPKHHPKDPTKIYDAWKTRHDVSQALNKVRDPALQIKHVGMGEDAFSIPEDPYATFGPSERSNNQELLTPKEVMTVPGAEIRVYFDPTISEKHTYGASIPITNRDQDQFIHYASGFKGELASDYTIDVQPTVPVEDSNYPYTLNRDGLKGEAKTAVNKIINAALMEASMNAKMRENDLIRKAFTDAIRIGKTRYTFSDLSLKIPANVKEKVSADPRFSQLSKSLSNGVDLLTAAMRSKGRVIGIEPGSLGASGDAFNQATFEGLATNGDFAGARFGTSQVGSPGKVYVDPFTIADSISRAIDAGHYRNDEQGLIDAYTDTIVGVLFHELGHQVSFEEGEGHARALTAMAGPMRKALTKAGSTLESVLRRFDMSVFHNDLNKLYEEFNKYYDAGIAQTIINAAKGNPLSGATTHSGNGQGRGNSTGDIGESRNAVDGSEDSVRYSGIDPKILANFYKTLFQHGSGINLLYALHKGTTSRMATLNPEGAILKWLSDGKLTPFRTEMSGKLQRTAKPVEEFLNSPKGVKWLNERSSKKDWDVSGLTGKDRVDALKYKALIEEIADIIDSHGIRVAELDPATGKTVYRRHQKAPGYFPWAIGEQVFTASGDELASMKKDFTAAWVKKFGKGADRAADVAFQNLLGMSRKEGVGSSPAFGPVRLPQGITLPESMRSKSPVDSLNRYINGVAKDVAWAVMMEKDPVGRRVLGVHHDPSGKDTFKTDPTTWDQAPDAWKYAVREGKRVRAKWALEADENKPPNAPINLFNDSKLLADMQNSYRMMASPNPNLQAVSNLGSSVILGTLSGVRDVGSSFVNTSALVGPGRALGGALSALFDTKGAVKRARTQGAMQEDMLVSEQIEAGKAMARGIMNAARFVRGKITFREQLDMYGQMLMHEALTEAMKTPGGKKLIEEFGPAFDPNMTEAEKVKLTAARLVERWSNRSTAQNITPGMLPHSSSPLSTALSLTRWSQAQWNNFSEDVINKWLNDKKNPEALKRFLSLALGGIVVGSAIDKLVAELYKRKPSWLSWGELFGVLGNDKIENDRKAKEFAYTAAAELQTLGALGTMGDAIMLPLVKKMAGEKNVLRGGLDIQYPAAIVGMDWLEKTRSFMTAVQAGRVSKEDFFQYLEELTKTAQNVRMGRALMERAGVMEEEEPIKGTREMRVFERVLGKDPKKFEEPRALAGQPAVLKQDPFSFSRQIMRGNDPENYREFLQGYRRRGEKPPQLDKWTMGRRYYQELESVIGEEEARKRMEKDKEIDRAIREKNRAIRRVR